MSYAHQFEVLLAELYTRKGFRVELNKSVVGRSWAKHEFDGYCVRGKYRKKVLVFEAKYSMNGSPVRLDDFSRFLTAVDDCRIPEAHLITNSYFSDNILSLALTYNIKLIDGKRLKKELEKYQLDRVIIRNDLMNNVVLPLAKLALDRIDNSKTLSKILLPKPQNRILYLDLNPYSEFYQALNKKFEEQHTELKPRQKENPIEKLLVNERPSISFSDIGGLEEVKNELRVSIVYPTLYKSLYEKFDIKPGNILLYGPPGCGKTLLAKAVANEAKSRFIAPKVSDLIKRYSANSLRVISSIFDYAREKEDNCIIFLDELDVYMKRGGSSYDERIKNEFLQQLDGINSERKFSLLGATNKPWLLDPAIRRPGRFDERIFVPPPDYEARKEILRIHMRDLINKQMVESVDDLIERIAERTEGWSGADLKLLVEKSKKRNLLDLIRGRKRKLTQKDFEKILEKQKPSTQAWFAEAIRACKRYGEEELLTEIEEIELKIKI